MPTPARRVSVRDRAARTLLAELNNVSKEKTAAKKLDHPDLSKFGEAVNVLKKQVHELFYDSEVKRDNKGDPATGQAQWWLPVR